VTIYRKESILRRPIRHDSICRYRNDVSMFSMYRSITIFGPVFHGSKAQNDVVRNSSSSRSRRSIKHERTDRRRERLRAACQQCLAIAVGVATVANGSQISTVASRSASWTHKPSTAAYDRAASGHFLPDAPSSPRIIPLYRHLKIRKTTPIILIRG